MWTDRFALPRHFLEDPTPFYTFTKHPLLILYHPIPLIHHNPAIGISMANLMPSWPYTRDGWLLISPRHAAACRSAKP